MFEKLMKATPDFDGEDRAARETLFRTLGDLPSPTPLTSVSNGTSFALQPDAAGKIYVYFAEAGEIFGTNAPSLGWSQHDMDAVMLALGDFTKVLGFTFEIVTDSSLATVKLVAGDADGSLGYSIGGAINFNIGTGGGAGFWGNAGQEALVKGGYSYLTIIHEFGHEFGLGHPHDNSLDTVIMQGVTADFGDYGDFDLNQGVYTMMSYNDGWATQPGGSQAFSLATAGYGWGTMGAFDIAGLQELYGIINPWATGDDVYELPDVNAIGTYFEAIWDTGGTDEIRYSGTRDVSIYLTAATLDYSATGGGLISYADGIFGGFTIANGVVIENATGGSGNDVIEGNDAANIINGGGGDDAMAGLGGDDVYYLDSAGDTVTELAAGGYDIVFSTVNVNAKSAAWSHIEAFEITGTATKLVGNTGDNELVGNALLGSVLKGLTGADTLTGGAERDILIGGGGDDHLIGSDGADLLDGRNANDLIEAGTGKDEIYGRKGDDDLYGGGGRDVLDGGLGVDWLYGEGGEDVLTGGPDRDLLTGGTEADVFDFNEGDMAATSHNGADRILDFSQAEGDLIDVSGLDAITGGGDDAFAFIGASAFSNTAGEMRWEHKNGNTMIYMDIDGDSLADYAIRLEGEIALSAADFVL